MPLPDTLTPRPLDQISNRTDGKDDAFEAMEELRDRGELAGRNMVDLEEEIGWSRQHISNVVDDYYQTPGDPGVPAAKGGGNGVETRLDIRIPDDVGDKEAFLRGYVQGYMHSQR